MNQYKIGDTVWTNKRGKGRIVNIWIEHTGYRPWLVRFEGMTRDVTPRLENLYPSEAAMEQAIQDQFVNANPVLIRAKMIGDELIVPLCNLKRFMSPFASGGIAYGRTTSIKPDPIQPKFKVGDAVYYKGGNWAIRERYWSGKEHRYNMSKPGISGDSLLIGISESGLRYWRQTTFHTRVVHDVTTKEFNADRFNTQGFDMRKVQHIGNSHRSDIFIYNADTNHATILYGYKGDDI